MHSGEEIPPVSDESDKGKKKKNPKKRGIWLASEFQSSFAKALKDCMSRLPLPRSGTVLPRRLVMNIRESLYRIFKEIQVYTSKHKTPVYSRRPHEIGPYRQSSQEEGA
jgi:hypothetical protein